MSFYVVSLLYLVVSNIQIIQNPSKSNGYIVFSHVQAVILLQILYYNYL